MSFASRWAESRSFTSNLLSLVRTQSSPADGELPEVPSSSRSKNKHRESSGPLDDDDNMTIASQELPPLLNDQEASDGEADFGALQIFDSNTAAPPASSQIVDASASASKKHRREKRKERYEPGSSKAQRRAHRHSSSVNGNNDANQPPATPASPSKKKRKHSDSSDGKDRRKKRKSHDDAANTPADTSDSSRRRKLELSAIGSVHEENAESDPQQSPPAVAHARQLSQSREAPSREGSAAVQDNTHDDAGGDGADADEMERDVEAVAREAWQEHISKQTAQQQQEADMVDAPPTATEATTTALVDEATEMPRRARSTRKKAKPTYFEQPIPEESLTAFGDLPSPSAMSPKQRRAKRAAPKKGARRERKLDRDLAAYADNGSLVRPTYTQGKFSDEELSRIAHAIESFRSEHDMQQSQVNEMIQTPGGTAAGEAHTQLWQRIFAECPDRHRQKVINIARKKFHNFVARGTWTLEQDNELASLINTHGPKWSFIAPIINRHPEDIRDRYRNYLVCGAAQKKEAWDSDEEARLTMHIQAAMKAIDRMREDDPSRQLLEQSYEQLIDWQHISESMGRTRSRLQCITKWKSMNLRLSSTEKLASAEANSTIPFRLEKARRQLEAMPDTEKYRLVLAINGSAAGSLEKIPWQRLCDKQFRTRWHRSTLELVWHRLMLSVPGADMRTVRDCAQFLVDRYDQDGELPNIGGEGFDDDNERALVAKVPFGTKDRLSVSSEKIDETDMQGDEKEGEADAEQQEPQEMQIDPALTEVPQSAKKATPAKRTQNGKRPSARKPRKAAEPIVEEEEAIVPEPVATANGHEISETSHRERKTPTKYKKSRASASKAVPQPSSDMDDMDDMEDVPSHIEA